MKGNKKVLIVAMAMLLIGTSGITSLAAGCSNYNLYIRGTARCTNIGCPGGWTREMRQDEYRQTCVRDNGAIYYNYKYKDVFISCNCYD